MTVIVFLFFPQAPVLQTLCLVITADATLRGRPVTS